MPESTTYLKRNGDRHTCVPLTVLARVRAVVIAELERHTTIIETVGLRSVTVTVKLKANGDPRAVLFYPEIEWECGEFDRNKKL